MMKRWKRTKMKKRIWGIEQDELDGDIFFSVFEK
jgi:hypothetical protein